MDRRRKELLEDLEKRLQKTLELVTWSGILEEAYGAVAISEIRLQVFLALGREADGQYALSSTYYTASGNRETPFQKQRLQLAVRASNRFAALVPRRRMTHDQLYVRAKILLTAEEYFEADQCLQVLFRRRRITPNEKVLGLTAWAESLIAQEQAERAADAYEHAFRIRPGVLPKSTQVIRLRSRAHYYKTMGKKTLARADLRKAIEIARKAKIDGQALKARQELSTLAASPTF